jgi:hypothetical protein
MSIKSTLLMIIVMCATCTFAQAQQPANKPAKALVDATKTCYASFNTALPNFCVTENGNIGQFIYPANYSQIYTDGYGVCDGTSTPWRSYYDVGVADSGNWQNSVITEPGGVNTLPLTIERTTSDGIWTITQVFSRNTADAYVKVVITLKNNTAATRSAWMTRYVDIDADGHPNTNYFDGTIDSGWGYQSAGVSYPNHGLTIRSNHSVHNYFGFSTPSGSYDTCNFNSNPVSSPAYGDEAVVYQWKPNGNYLIPGGKSITVTLEYRPM